MRQFLYICLALTLFSQAEANPNPEMAHIPAGEFEMGSPDGDGK
ncbi:MAG: hypothetical protein OSA05_08435 [Nitrospinaceae bacterium]|nr:hypothetical protein [Nitrospinaceae bacterium]